MSNDVKNVVLVLVDQLRADALHATGNPYVKTPNIDKLVREGVCFDNMYCQSPICVPARASLLSGRYVFSHCVADNKKLLPDSEFSYARALRAAGYTAACVGRSHHIDNGFQTVPVPNRDSFEFDTIKNNPFGISNFYLTGKVEYVKESFDMRVTDTACAFLEDMALRQPFAMQVGFLAPHNPFAIPERYVDMYKPEDMPLPEDNRELEIPPMLQERYKKDSWLSDRDIQVARACYYSLVTMIDDCVGKLIQKLKDLGVYDNTLFILMADHGDMLGDRRLVAKSVAYDSAAKIPCIMTGGGLPNGKRISCVTEQIDVTATILDYAGISPPEMVHGRSLFPVMTGEQTSHKGYAFSQMPTWRMYRDERYKLILHTDGYGELYDMVNDPREIVNLYESEDHANVRGRLEKEMLMLYITTQGQVTDLFPQCKQPLGAFRTGIGN